MEFDLNSDKSRISEIIKEARAIALHAALKIDPDYEKFDYSTIPQTFGEKWFRRMVLVRERLCEKYGENADALVFFSKRFFIYAIEYHYAFLRAVSVGEIAVGIPDEYKLDSKVLTPLDYADSEGWAELLYGTFAPLSISQAVLSGTPFTELPRSDYVLESISLHWFFVASNSYQTESAKALDLLFESSDALALASGHSMWEGAHENGREESRRAGEAGAQKRHAPMRQLEQWALEKYREREWGSANEASHELMGVILAESRVIGANLKPSNAQRSIYSWFLKADKLNSV